jgi:hypothetical protein
VRFSYRMVPEVYQVFWAGMAAGEFINDAAIAASSYSKQGSRWLAAAGGVRPRRGRGLRGSVSDVGAAGRDRAWSGPRRLHSDHRCAPRPVTVDVAIARELAGWAWSLAVQGAWRAFLTEHRDAYARLDAASKGLTTDECELASGEVD